MNGAVSLIAGFQKLFQAACVLRNIDFSFVFNWSSAEFKLSRSENDLFLTFTFRIMT